MGDILLVGGNSNLDLGEVCKGVLKGNTGSFRLR